MSAITERATTITARIPETLKSDLDELVQSTKCDQNVLIEQAIRRFVEFERGQTALIEDRVKQADAGNFASDEEVARVYAKFNISHRDQSERAAG